MYWLKIQVFYKFKQHGFDGFDTAKTKQQRPMTHSDSHF